MLKQYSLNAFFDLTLPNFHLHGHHRCVLTVGLFNLAAFWGFCFSTLALNEISKATASERLKNSLLKETIREEKILTVQKVAILPFESSNLYIAGKSFSETLTEHLTKKIGRLIVIERLEIDKVLAEQKFSMTGAVKSSQKENSGAIEPVDAIIIGTVRTMEYFGEDGGSIVVTVKMVDIGNGQILWSHKQEARCYSVGIDRKDLAEELMNRAAKKIVKRLKSDLLAKEQKQAQKTG